MPPEFRRHLSFISFLLEVEGDTGGTDGTEFKRAATLVTVERIAVSFYCSIDKNADTREEAELKIETHTGSRREIGLGNFSAQTGRNILKFPAFTATDTEINLRFKTALAAHQIVHAIYESIEALEGELLELRADTDILSIGNGQTGSETLGKIITDRSSELIRNHLRCTAGIKDIFCELIT